MLRMLKKGGRGTPGILLKCYLPHLCPSLAAHVGKPALFSKRLNLVGLEVDEFSIAEEC